MYEIIGVFAACLTTASFVPQVIKIIRTKNTESISLQMYVVFITGVFCWIIYGAHLGSMQMMIANSVTFVLAGIILFLKIRDLRAKAKNKKY